VLCQNTEKKTILGVNPSFFGAFCDERLVEEAKKLLKSQRNSGILVFKACESVSVLRAII